MVAVTGPISTTATSDVYSTHDSKLGLGGYREVADLTARNAITTERRREGMLVYTASDHTIWILKASPWAGTNADWEPAFDAGDIGVISITGGGTGATTVHAARVNLGAVTGLSIPIPGNGTLTSFDLTHSMNFAWTFPPSVVEVSTGAEVIPDVYVLNSNTVRVSFGSAPASGQFNLIVLGMDG